MWRAMSYFLCSHWLLLLFSLRFTSHTDWMAVIYCSVWCLSIRMSSLICVRPDWIIRGGGPSMSFVIGRVMFSKWFFCWFDTTVSEVHIFCVCHVLNGTSELNTAMFTFLSVSLRLLHCVLWLRPTPAASLGGRQHSYTWFHHGFWFHEDVSDLLICLSTLEIYLHTFLIFILFESDW